MTPQPREEYVIPSQPSLSNTAIKCYLNELRDSDPQAKSTESFISPASKEAKVPTFSPEPDALLYTPVDEETKHTEGLTVIHEEPESKMGTQTTSLHVAKPSMSKEDLKAENERLKQQISHLNGMLFQRNMEEARGPESATTLVASGQLNTL